MGLKIQTTREWVVIVGLPLVLIVILFWVFLIMPWLDKIESNNKEIVKAKTNLTMVENKLKQSVELDSEYVNLIDSYSNYLSKIRDVRMPDNLKDVLVTEIYNIDQQYDLDTKGIDIRDPQTHDMYKLLPYVLTGVESDWESLNMLLALIEDAGQLVGFENMTINSVPPSRNKKGPSKMKISNMRVKSYMFDNSTNNWQLPPYTNVINNLNRNIFELPKRFTTNLRLPTKPITTLPLDEVPPWSRSIILTAIVDFGQPRAIFNDKGRRLDYTIDVGGTISNTMPLSILKSIDFDKEEIIVDTGLKEYVLRLRTYSDLFLIGTKEDLDLGAGLKAVEDNAKFGQSDLVDAAESTNAIIKIVLEKTVVPDKYDYKLGNHATSSFKFGAYTCKVDTFLKRRRRLASDYGMMVYRVQKLSPAAKAGLRERDVILEVDGKKVDDTKTFTYALNEAYKNNRAKISLTMMRGVKVQQLTINME